MDWYAVKLVYQMKIHGKPRGKDAFYSLGRRVYYEESVILLEAESFDDAYRLAEPVAAENCTSYTNRYGQLVRTKVFAYVDCYWIGGEVKSGTEVYSSIYAAEHGEKKKGLLKKRYKSCEAEEMYMLRNSAFLKTEN